MSTGKKKDLNFHLATLEKDNTSSWIFIEQGLDHGPFSARQIVQMIVEGEILPDHEIRNMYTSQCKVMKDWDEFSPFIEKQKIILEKREKEKIIKKVKIRENRFGFVKVVASLCVLFVIGISIWGFIITRKKNKHQHALRISDIEDLFKRGAIEIKGSTGILPPFKNKKKRGTRRKRTSGFRSYEEAMSIAMSKGNLDESGGEAQLTSEQIQSVMNKQLNTIYSTCIRKELYRNKGLKEITIDLAISGGGEVMGSSVRNGSNAFGTCVQKLMGRVKFPPFSAPRMGARYSFSLQ